MTWVDSIDKERNVSTTHEDTAGKPFLRHFASMGNYKDYISCVSGFEVMETFEKVIVRLGETKKYQRHS